MNFKSIINDICCDSRIKDGVFNLENVDHVFILQEYLENLGLGIDEIVDKTADLFEAGRFPERQAYNKDGILVTFPNKEYRDRAVNKGTHFAENPKKSQSNLFTTPPEDLKQDAEKKDDGEEQKDAVPVDKEVEKDVESDDKKDERSPEAIKQDAVANVAILSGETPLVNYSVDEAIKYGFYKKGMMWYDNEGNLIGEQVFDEASGKKVVNKNKPELTKADLSDLETLRLLGLEKFEEEEIIPHLKDNISNVTLSPGSNNKYGLTTPVNRSGLQNILNKEDSLIITYSGGTKKIRTKDNIRIAQWSTAKSYNDVDFKRALMVYDFYQKNKGKIELVAKPARGIGYEKMQVQNLNTWFDKHDVIQPLRLYISDELNKFRDTGVNVNGATKLAGTGKADLALTDNQTPKFWISYKHGNYWTEEGSSLATVPFQQYGSIKTLHKKLSTEKGKWNQIINNFLDELIPNIKSTFSIKGGEDLDKLKSLTPDQLELFSANFPTIKNILANPANERLNKLFYFLPNGFNAWMDMLDGTDEARQIAGMSIYGLDFKLNSTNYGPENVQCLIQTNEPLVVDYNYDQDDEPSGVKVSTDKRGHILFNPNLPAPKDAEDPILQYRPVLNARYTEVENFVFTRSNSVIILLGCRILVMPHGKIPGTSIKL